MSGFRKVVPCAAIAAVLFAGSSRLTGQAPVENGRSVALAASDDTLPAALDRVDAMLTGGQLNISSLHDDTMIAGRAIERLGQFHEGLPVFGGQVVRQMDGRAIVSVTGRLYEALDVDVTPSISPERANEVAVAAAGAGANIRGETTLGILPVESGYRLVYRMTVLSDWAIREVYVDADSGEIVLVDQRHPHAGRHRTGQRHFRHAQENEHEPDVDDLSGRRQAASGRSLHARFPWHRSAG